VRVPVCSGGVVSRFRLVKDGDFKFKSERLDMSSQCNMLQPFKGISF
jgi:hypothetical protein